MQSNLDKMLKRVQRNCNKFTQLRDLGVDKSGEITASCISCGRVKVINNTYDLKECHAGHYFLENKYSSVRFDPMNINLQCSRCNRRLHGNLSEYKIGLIKKIGEKAFEDLEIRKNKLKKWDIIELEELNKQFLKKIKELKKKFGGKI